MSCPVCSEECVSLLPLLLSFTLYVFSFFLFFYYYYYLIFFFVSFTVWFLPVLTLFSFYILYKCSFVSSSFLVFYYKICFASYRNFDAMTRSKPTCYQSTPAQKYSVSPDWAASITVSFAYTALVALSIYTLSSFANRPDNAWCRFGSLM